ncbi:MAG: hypothetical protein ACMUHU_00060 [Thermoplasmatota archaeon]
MDMGLLLSAALIGFSFSNTFMCTVIALSTFLGRGLKAGLGFLAGRTTGIMVFGVIMALFGFLIEIDTQLMLYIFGGMTLAFGMVILVFPGLSRKLGLIQSCESGACEECGDSPGSDPKEDHDAHNCSECPSSAQCPSKDGNNGPGRRKQMRPSSGAQDTRFGKFGVLGVFAMGAVRGATPCLKVVLLLPLIVSLPFFESLAVTSTYALSSSLYPIAGIAIASIAGDIFSPRLRKYLAKVGAAAMVGIGIYFLYKAWTYTCSTGI